MFIHHKMIYRILKVSFKKFRLNEYLKIMEFELLSKFESECIKTMINQIVKLVMQTVAFCSAKIICYLLLTIEYRVL